MMLRGSIVSASLSLLLLVGITPEVRGFHVPVAEQAISSTTSTRHPSLMDARFALFSSASEDPYDEQQQQQPPNPEQPPPPSDQAPENAAPAAEESSAPPEDPEVVRIKEEIANLESALKSKRLAVADMSDRADEMSKAGYARKVAEMENMRRARSVSSIT